MEKIEMIAIQDYLEKSGDGQNVFIWKMIQVPKCKEDYVYLMNGLIPMLFQLPHAKRKNEIDQIILMNHNNGINQYFPFLKDHASEEVRNFICAASDSDTLNLSEKQKRQ